MDMNKVIEEMQKLGSNLANIAVEGTAGEGMVVIKMNGKQEILNIKIDAGALRLTPENLGSLLKEAFSEALFKSRQWVKDEITRYTGSMQLPNITNLF